MAWAVNSLWPSDIMWWHISGSTLVQVMARCLTAPSHYLNQYWPPICEVLWHSSESNFTVDMSAQATILYNEFENHNFKITVTFPRRQWVKIHPQRDKDRLRLYSQTSCLLKTWQHQEPGHQQHWHLFSFFLEYSGTCKEKWNLFSTATECIRINTKQNWVCIYNYIHWTCIPQHIQEPANHNKHILMLFIIKMWTRCEPLYIQDYIFTKLHILCYVYIHIYHDYHLVNYEELCSTETLTLFCL